MIIDAHIHCPVVEPFFQWFPFTTCYEDFFSYLKKYGIDRFVAFTNGKESITETNIEMLKLWREKPDIIIPALCFDPQDIVLTLKEMEKGRENGIIWVGEFIDGDIDFYSQDFKEILKKASELKMILNVHLYDETENLFEHYYDEYPDVTFVMAHLYDDIEKTKNKANILSKYPNAYLDISGSGVDRLGLWEHVISVMSPEHVLFGSDYPINDPAIYLARLESLRVPQEDKNKIQYANMERLLHERGVG